LLNNYRQTSLSVTSLPLSSIIANYNYNEDIYYTL
jgi:hypothetical protein